MLALGGGAVGTDQIQKALRERALTVLVEVDPEEAWRRVEGGDRPLAQDEAAFRTLYEERRPLYDAAADARTADLDGAVLAAGGVHVETGALELLGELVPGDGPVALVSDAPCRRDLRDGRPARARRPRPRDPRARARRGGEDGRVGRGALARASARALAARSSRSAAAARPTSPGSPPRPTSAGSTGSPCRRRSSARSTRRSAARRRSTSRAAKNLVGAFHWPVRTVIDPATLETLPRGGARERPRRGRQDRPARGEPLWELPLDQQVRRAPPSRRPSASATRTTAASAPRSTSATRSRTRSRRRPASSSRTAAPSRSACSRRSGSRASTRTAVEETLRPEPVRVDRERAWAALARDKKAVGGTPRLVLLDAPGKPRVGVEVPPRARRSRCARLDCA